MSIPCHVATDLIHKQQADFIAEAIQEKIQREVESDFDAYEYLYELNASLPYWDNDKRTNKELAEFAAEIVLSDDPVTLIQYFKDSLIERVVESRMGDYE